MCDSEEVFLQEESLSSHTAPGTNWYLVGLERINHTRWVDQYHLSGTATEKMIQLRAWHKSRLKIPQRVAMYILCRQLFIGIGTVGCTSSILEAQAFHETQFETFVRSDILTRGFERPHSLADDAALFERLPNFVAGGDCSVIRHVLVVGHELDRTRAFLIFTLAAMLTLGAGVGVGAAEHQLELGATVGAAVFGCLAIVQVAVIWTNK